MGLLIQLERSENLTQGLTSEQGFAKQLGTLPLDLIPSWENALEHKSFYFWLIYWGLLYK